jgi:phosphotransferase system IIB component
MQTINKRKYNSLFRKTLKDKISKLNNKNDYIYIYKIISYELDSKLSINRNGIYFNLNMLSDECIEKLILYLNDKFDSEINTEQTKIKYEIYSKDNNSNVEFIYGPKLTNQEKTILKKLHTKNNN